MARVHAQRIRPGGQRLDDRDFATLVEDARKRHNLSDVAARHTSLKKRGPRELVGLCPFHTERSPSFEVNDTKGTYHCHGCGEGGDAITLLTKLEGMRFMDAVRWLHGDQLPVVSEHDRAQRAEADKQQLADRITLARTIWGNVVPAAGTPAEVYARSRGITMPLPETVGFVMTPRWRDSETGEVGRDHPAMACALQNVEGDIVGVQCIFLQDGGQSKYQRLRPDGKPAKAKLSFGQIVGSALRLGPPAHEIVCTEGPEDGLTLAQDLPGRSVWVACGTAMMPRMVLPPEVASIVLAGDNNAAGQTAVDLATAAYLDQGLGVRSIFPDPAFKDWNDQLRGRRI